MCTLLSTMRVALGAALLLPLLSGYAAGCGLHDLAFLEGDWRYVQGRTQGAERWTRTAADTWAGSTWESDGGALSFAEAASIVIQDGFVLMRLRHFDGSLAHAWEEKNAPIVFRLARCDAHAAVFDGTGTKAGEHITYRRSGDDLDFIGDFLRNGQPRRVELHMTRVSN